MFSMNLLFNDPQFPRHEWKKLLRAGKTRLSYKDYVEANKRFTERQPGPPQPPQQLPADDAIQGLDKLEEPVMGKPKIVQIALLPQSENFLPALYALDSDGCIWVRTYTKRGDPGVWQTVPSPFDKVIKRRRSDDCH